MLRCGVTGSVEPSSLTFNSSGCLLLLGDFNLLPTAVATKVNQSNFEYWAILKISPLLHFINSCPPVLHTQVGLVGSFYHSHSWSTQRTATKCQDSQKFA